MGSAIEGNNTILNEWRARQYYFCRFQASKWRRRPLLLQNAKVNETRLKKLLADVAEGRIRPATALTKLRKLPFEDLGFAHVDHHRVLRIGRAEVILAAGKSASQVIAIARTVGREHPNVLITRADAALAQKLRRRLPGFEYFPASGILRRWRDRHRIGKGTIVVVSAGTSDYRVAEEAWRTAETLGHRVEIIQDVGVAGLHRLLGHWDQLTAARVVIVVAGMEGALPSVVGGMIGVPVIAVPTSIGYGAGLGGVGALMGMLNACASNVVTVNIDNGFGAGYVAALINNS